MGVKTAQHQEEAWEEEEEDWEKEAPPAKKAKKKAKVAAAGEEEWWEDAAPKKKGKKAKSKRTATPEDLESGTVVLYWDGWRGVVRDAFVPLDEFWVADEESGEIVRDEQGDIVHFKSAELELVAGPPVAPPHPNEDFQSGDGSVLLVGTEPHMLKILQHFGSPDTTERHDPQQLLAIPCNMCDPDALLGVATEGVVDSVRELAAKLRPDIHVALRVFHLKHAIRQLEDLMALEGMYCLTSVNLPFSKEDIDAFEDKWERKYRKEVCNQIDMNVTASDRHQEGDTSPKATAQRALGETCGLSIVEDIWAEEAQTALREQLGVSGLPLKLLDVNGGRVFVLLLPEDAETATDNGILWFAEEESKRKLRAKLGRAGTDAGAGAGAGANAAAEPASAAVREQAAAEEQEPHRQQSPQQQTAANPAQLGGSEAKLGGKTVKEWEAEQADFEGGPKLPPGWIRVRSRSSDDVYYFNKRTQESTFDMPEHPLPEGWTKQVSKTTGKTYYFNAKRKLSSFELPTE